MFLLSKLKILDYWRILRYMVHHLRLHEGAFEDMKAGFKKREYRLNDEKRKQIKIGDRIKFFKLPDINESILTEVEGLLHYRNWYSCYEDFFDQDLSRYYENIEAAVQDTYDNWWPKEKEEKYGCLIIKIKLIDYYI